MCLLPPLLQHVENFVVNVACDDPGAAVGTQLVLPLLQERLDVRALEYAAQRAEQAQQEVIRMEVRSALPRWLLCCAFVPPVLGEAVALALEAFSEVCLPWPPKVSPAVPQMTLSAPLGNAPMALDSRTCPALLLWLDLDVLPAHAASPSRAGAG